MDKRAFFETWYQRFWINEDLDAAADMAPETVVVRGLTDAPQTTREGLRGFGAALLGLCNFDQIDIKRFVEDGDWAHMLVEFRGTARASGAPIRFDAQIMARTENDQIVEAYNHPDFITLFQQLGSLPQDAMARCLSNAPLS